MPRLIRVMFSLSLSSMMAAPGQGSNRHVLWRRTPHEDVAVPYAWLIVRSPDSWSPHGLCGSTQGRGEAHPDLVDLALQGGNAVLALAHLLRQLRLLVAQAVRLAVGAPVDIQRSALVLLRSLCTTLRYS